MAIEFFPNDHVDREGHTKVVRRVPYLRWLFSLVAWDGILPAFMLLSPTVVKTLFPNQRGAIEFTGVILPIVVFFVRFFVAKHHIRSNGCTALVRGIQYITLSIGILILLLIDSVVILACDLPNGALFATTTDVIVSAILFTIYLSCMAVALYPGRTEESLDGEQ